MYLILESNYKNVGFVIRGIKTILRPKEFYRAGTAPPGFEIPGSATGHHFDCTITIKLKTIPETQP